MKIIKTNKGSAENTMQVLLFVLGAVVVMGLAFLIIDLLSANTDYEMCKAQIDLAANGAPVGFYNCHEYVLEFGEKSAIKYDLVRDDNKKIKTYKYSTEVQKLKNIKMNIPEDKEKEYAVYSIIMQEMVTCDSTYYVDSMYIHKNLINCPQTSWKTMARRVIGRETDTTELLGRLLSKSDGPTKSDCVSYTYSDYCTLLAKPCVTLNFDNQVFKNKKFEDIESFSSIAISKETDGKTYEEYFKRKYLQAFGVNFATVESSFNETYENIKERYFERIKNDAEKKYAACRLSYSEDNIIDSLITDKTIYTYKQYRISIAYIMAEMSSTVSKLAGQNISVAVPYNINVLTPSKEISAFEGVYLPMG